MDVTGRRQTEAVVAAAAECGQTKLQVVVKRRLHLRGTIWMATTICLLPNTMSSQIENVLLLPVFLLPWPHGIA